MTQLMRFEEDYASLYRELAHSPLLKRAENMGCKVTIEFPQGALVLDEDQVAGVCAVRMPPTKVIDP